MKKCGTCKLDLDESKFYFKSRERDLLQSECKSCKSLYTKRWYRKNKKDHIANVGRRSAEVRKEIRKKLYEYLLSHPCIDCGEGDPVVLEFDHKYGKRRNVSQSWSWKSMLAEIKKCVVRCANCHRRKTAKQLGWWKATVEKMDS